MHLDPILPLDLGCFTIIAAHVNLTIGTIARCLSERPDLRSLVESLLNFDMVGVYLLTERGHGLDAFNIETTATMHDGGFILHTPREEATKYAYRLLGLESADVDIQDSCLPRHPHSVYQKLPL